MKILLFIIVTFILVHVGNAQSDAIDYFGQTPPGDTTVIFAPGIISLPTRNESNITFSPDGNEVYLEGNDGIYFTKRVNNIWSQQAKEPIFDGFNNPVFSANGKKMYLTKWSSDYSTSDIWMSDRTSTVWNVPQILPEPFNSSAVDGCYTETDDGVLYISSNRSGKGNIWCIRPSATQAENLGTVINTPSASDPCIAHDGSYLIFWSDRPGCIGVGDLYVSFNKGNNIWTAPIDMESNGAGINSAKYNVISPSLSPDGKYLFMNRHSFDLSVMPDIYWVSTHILVGLKKTVFAPRLNKQIPNLDINTDSTINYIIPSNTFSCEYGTDSLKYIVTLSNGSVLPSWLNFNSATRTLSGKPRQTETDTIKITATNKDTISATCSFRITVTASAGEETVTDIDGNVYNTVTIGTQVWMKENLKTTHYNDGTAIPNVTDGTAWAALTTSAYCWYNNDAVTNKATYGALYNWYTINTGKLYPLGWHVPTDAEFTTLENFLIDNGYNYDGTTTGNKYAKALASDTGWMASTTAGAVGNTDYPAKRNATGFTALPAGDRYDFNGAFSDVGTSGIWWSSTTDGTTNVWCFLLANIYANADLSYGDKHYGFSVRCIKDASTGVNDSKYKTQIPGEMKLNQNYPNPFNPSTVISYRLSVASNIKLTIYNVLGQKIKTLVSSFQNAGEHSVVWDAMNDKNNQVSSGMYFYRLEASDKMLQKKMLLIR